MRDAHACIDAEQQAWATLRNREEPPPAGIEELLSMHMEESQRRRDRSEAMMRAALAGGRVDVPRGRGKIRAREVLALRAVMQTDELRDLHAVCAAAVANHACAAWSERTARAAAKSTDLARTCATRPPPAYAKRYGSCVTLFDIALAEAVRESAPGD